MFRRGKWGQISHVPVNIKGQRGFRWPSQAGSEGAAPWLGHLSRIVVRCRTTRRRAGVTTSNNPSSPPWLDRRLDFQITSPISALLQSKQRRASDAYELLVGTCIHPKQRTRPSCSWGWMDGWLRGPLGRRVWLQPTQRYICMGDGAPPTAPLIW